MLDLLINPRTDEKKNEVTFLIEEYKNIASTHDKLRDELGRLFNYFLLLSAFPFTILGLMFRQDGLSQFKVLSAPVEIHLLFLVVGLGHLALALTIVHARRRQYGYARTVNLIRKYFRDQAPVLEYYLLLPTSADVSHYDKLGHVAYQVNFMLLVGVIFFGYGMWGIAPSVVEVDVVAAAVIAYTLVYTVFKRIIQVEKKP